MFTFLCWFSHHNKLYSISQFWEIKISFKKSFITSTPDQNNTSLPKTHREIEFNTWADFVVKESHSEVLGNVLSGRRLVFLSPKSFNKSFGSSKAAESKQNIQQVSHTVILPMKLVFSGRILRQHNSVNFETLIST